MGEVRELSDDEVRLVDFWRKLTDRQRVNFLKLIAMSDVVRENFENDPTQGE